MGIFTLTLADSPTRKLAYNAKGYLCCPDGTFLTEPSYEGYGIFDGKDIFELVVDWNREFLNQIYAQKKNSKLLQPSLKEVTFAAMVSDDEAQKTAMRLVDERKLPRFYILQESPMRCVEWKRAIGIDLIGDGNTDCVKYPIKVVTSRKVKYEDLPASKIVQ